VGHHFQTDEKVIMSVEEIYRGTQSDNFVRLLLNDLAWMRVHLLVLNLTGIPAAA